jgi:hypothetical protein
LVINRKLLFQGFKYVVYAFLAMNIFWFFIEEHAATALQFADGVTFANLFEAYAATIDTAAWVVLLLIFELETFVLDDDQMTRRMNWTLQAVRILCYALIVRAFVGYIENLLFFDGVSIMAAGTELCALADGWSYAVDLDEFEAITAANCSVFGTTAALYQFPGMQAVVDSPGLFDIRALAWVDVINAGVWLLVVLVLDLDVRLQERNRLEGSVLRISNALKVVFYSILFLAAVYWGVKGDFVDFWDAFLWLVAFFFIEMNVVEWRHETEAAEAGAQDVSQSG